MAGTPPETEMRKILLRMGVEFTEQERVAGHRIDFVLRGRRGLVLVDPNGDRWHRWQKIVDCDRKKLNRVIAAGALPMGVWWSRIQKEPQGVADAIVYAVEAGRLRFWDWAVPVGSLDRAEGRRVARLVDWSFAHPD